MPDAAAGDFARARRVAHRSMRMPWRCA